MDPGDVAQRLTDIGARLRAVESAVSLNTERCRSLERQLHALKKEVNATWREVHSLQIHRAKSMGMVAFGMIVVIPLVSAFVQKYVLGD